MNNQVTRKEVFVNFLKRYGYIVVLSILMITMAVILAVSASNNKGNDNNTNVNTGKLEFYSPVLNATVIKDYSDTKLFWNDTLKQYEAHKALDLKVVEGSDVFAVLDGTVDDVFKNDLEGTVVVISHSNGLKTYYSSLEKEVTVKKGDIVKKGNKIGTAGNTAKSEVNTGAHLHFAVEKDGSKVDPNSYLSLTSKS